MHLPLEQLALLNSCELAVELAFPREVQGVARAGCRPRHVPNHAVRQHDRLEGDAIRSFLAVVQLSLKLGFTVFPAGLEKSPV